MINSRELARALARRRIASWVVIERAQEIATADEARALRRREKRTLSSMIVHHDQYGGRGTAHLDLAASDHDPHALVEQAIALASASLGPVWKSVPPAAPAKVSVFDAELDKQPLDDAAAAVVAGLRRPPGVTVSTTVQVLREQVAVHSQAGFNARWTASTIHAEALVAAPERSLAITRTARRLADLGLADAVATAAADLELLANAGAPVPGPCALVLTEDALLHGTPLGVWSVFAAQADSLLERQGLTRYRLDALVAPNADQVREPLTIVSDGSLDFATRSSPIGDDGDAVRRFALVRAGRAVGLGLSAREAALRKSDPNGGVRNLVVAPGTWIQQLPVASQPRTIEVRRLRALSIDPYTGDASLELALANEYKGSGRRAFTGGTIRLDLVTALAFARRNLRTVRRGAYDGPASVLIESAELFG